MEGVDRGGEDQTFRANFTGEGAEKLRERVKEKLKEFMGDYTDDTLVEYVIVLLRNGRRKDEARKELNVFLGDDSVSFVSWLWDHLSSNLHNYVQPKQSFPEELGKTKPRDELSTRHDSQQEHVSTQTDSEYEREQSTKLSRSRRNREWKGLAREETLPFPLRSTVTENFPSEERANHRPNLVRRSRSPRPLVHKKRIRQDERQPMKRETSHPVIGAPRRLLQFAVRDAVRTVQQPSSRTEPALKRLRSVVSTSTTDTVHDERPQRTRSVARVQGAVATALKAAAEPAEDAIKARSSGNVFDRLGHDTAETINQASDFREPVLEDGEYEDLDQIPESKGLDYYHRSEYGDFDGNVTMLDRETGVALDSASDNDGYDNVGIGRHRVLGTSQSASSANKEKKSLMVQYSIGQDTDEVVRKTKLMDQDPPATAAGNASRKIVNISVNVNTCPPHYQASRDVMEVENRMALDKSEVGTAKANVRLVKETNTARAESEHEMMRADVQKEVQKTVASMPGSYSTARPSEDADSRTVFVNNVHFGATKDTLSRHFNKFGEVLKVIIVTDAATGQPKGSAYVEFLRKESAELALSLNGTSFMSRILKVVQRSFGHHEAASMMSWPSIARASPFASRLRVPFPRGILAGAYRARLPIKSGARSLQWKRGAPNAQTAECAKSIQSSTSLTSGSSVLSPTGRSLTYVRSTESKPEGNSGPA